jgi:hypothetical protein
MSNIKDVEYFLSWKIIFYVCQMELGRAMRGRGKIALYID